MSDVIRVVQIGLGPIGQRMVREIKAHPLLTLAGAMDVDPAKVGKDAGVLAGLEEPLDVPVRGSLAELGEKPADVAVLTTASKITVVAQSIIECCERGLPVVSTCEELAYPWKTDAATAKRIDDAARANGVAVLGTGVNPGFLMDLLPIVLSGVCRRVDSLRVERYQDASRRRIPFQVKIGAGLSVEQFEQRVAKGTIRHVGLTESMHMIAARLGWSLDRTEDRITPLITHEPLPGPHGTIEAGQVKGVHQVGEGYMGDKLVINLIFHAAIQQPKPQDRIVIRGEPDFESVVPGGVHGDVATCAIVLNAIPVILRAKPGLRTMADIEPIGCFQG